MLSDVTGHQMLFADQKQDGVGGTCGTCGREEIGVLGSDWKT